MQNRCKCVTLQKYNNQLQGSIMATKNPRINVTFEENIVKLLAQLAKREHKSVAGLVKELTLTSLEMREDLYLSEIARELDKKGVKTYSHSEAWK